MRGLPSNLDTYLVTDARDGRILRTTKNFTEHGPNPFGTFGHFDVEKFLYGKGVVEFVGHYRASVNSWL
jgi:hypothetical protein